MNSTALVLVHHEGRMVLPALNMQEITYSKIWRLTGTVRHLSVRLRNECGNWRDAADSSNSNSLSVEKDDAFVGILLFGRGEKV